MRLEAGRGYDLTVGGALFQARRLYVSMLVRPGRNVAAMLDTGAYFSFFPQHIWAGQLHEANWQIVDPDRLLWRSGMLAAPQPWPPGSSAFDAAIHRATGVGLGPEDAIRCDFALVRTRLYDPWGGDSGPLQLPSLLGHTDELPRGRRPANVVLGFAGVLDRARLSLDYANGSMHLTFPSAE